MLQFDPLFSIQGARDEFTLDLVEQCSFQKERVMHLVMTSRQVSCLSWFRGHVKRICLFKYINQFCLCRDEKAVSKAIELNEQLQRILNRHEDLLSGRITVPSRSTTSNGYHSNLEPVRSISNGHQKPELKASNANTESSSSISNRAHLKLEEEDEEEEPEQLFRRSVLLTLLNI